MMTLPIVLAVIGTLIVVVSATVSDFYVSGVEKDIEETEAELGKINESLAGKKEQIESSDRFFFNSKTLLLMAQLGKLPEKALRGAMHSATYDMMQGLVNRYAAANGSGPSDEYFKVWNEKVNTGLLGNQAKIEEFSKESERLKDLWADSFRDLLTGKEAKQQEISKMKRKSTGARHIAVSLQIIGVIIVLLKDIATG